MSGFWGLHPLPVARLAPLVWASAQSGCFLLGYDGLATTPDSGFERGDAGDGDGSGQLMRDGSVGGDDVGVGKDSGLSEDSGSGTDGPGSDAGEDAGSDAPPPYGWWEGFAPNTMCGGVPGAACNQTCAAGSQRCVLDCNVLAACSSTCASYTTCRSTCSGTSCTHTCAAYANCSYESKASQTIAKCASGSTCDITCTNAATCNLDCLPGASCLFRCEGLTCNPSCSGVKLTCEDGTVVCDRACPK